LDPLNETALAEKGKILSNLGDETKGLECFNVVLKTNPENLDILIRASELYRRKHCISEELACCDRIVKIVPQNDSAWRKKGDVLFDLRKYGLALACFDKALQINSTNKSALEGKERALERLNQLDLNQRAAEWHNEGAQLWNKNCTDEAMRCFKMALKINPVFEPTKTTMTLFSEMYP
jgi:tetratricopeptide (TPR) repeat protein